MNRNRCQNKRREIDNICATDRSEMDLISVGFSICYEM